MPIGKNKSEDDRQCYWRSAVILPASSYNKLSKADQEYFEEEDLDEWLDMDDEECICEQFNIESIDDLEDVFVRRYPTMNQTIENYWDVKFKQEGNNVVIWGGDCDEEHEIKEYGYDDETKAP